MKPEAICSEIARCRICRSSALESVIDLGRQFIATHFVRGSVPEWLDERYPLELVRCSGPGACGLVQLRHTLDSKALYFDYGYRSGINQTMPANLASIVSDVCSLVDLAPEDTVLDIGCNDGTLLSGYPPAVRDRLGIDPSLNVAAFAQARGLEVLTTFFSRDAYRAARGEKRAKVITSIAMFYDLPDPMSFVSDIASVLASDGVWVIELSYLPLMLQNRSYDTVCHEHLEYYALAQITWMLERCGLKLQRVAFNAVNGGSFRLFIRPAAFQGPIDHSSIEQAQAKEHALRLDTDKPYAAFRNAVTAARDSLCRLLADLREAGKTVYLYGASTKGNTILQHCGIDQTLIPKAADRNSDKWGRRTLGTNIEIISEDEARRDKPDYFLVLPWPFFDEFRKRERDFLDRGGKFILPLPEVRVVGRDDP